MRMVPSLTLLLLLAVVLLLVSSATAVVRQIQRHPNIALASTAAVTQDTTQGGSCCRKRCFVKASCTAVTITYCPSGPAGPLVTCSFFEGDGIHNLLVPDDHSVTFTYTDPPIRSSALTFPGSLVPLVTCDGSNKSPPINPTLPAAIPPTQEPDDICFAGRTVQYLGNYQDWNAAYEECKTLGGSFFIPRSVDDKECLTAMLEKEDVQNVEVWIGLHDLGANPLYEDATVEDLQKGEGTWLWMDGSVVVDVFGYEVKDFGHPTKEQGHDKPHNDCGMIKYHNDGREELKFKQCLHAIDGAFCDTTTDSPANPDLSADTSPTQDTSSPTQGPSSTTPVKLEITGKPIKASSIRNDDIGTEFIADNNGKTKWSSKVDDEYPWVIIDLEASYRVREVHVENPFSDCCGHWFQGIEIRVGRSTDLPPAGFDGLTPDRGISNNLFSNMALFVSYPGPYSSTEPDPLVLSNPAGTGVTGRYISIQRVTPIADCFAGNPEGALERCCLKINELQVFGNPKTP